MKKEMIIFGILIFFSFVQFVGAENYNNYVWNESCTAGDDTCFIPWIATAEGKPKMDINLMNVTSTSVVTKNVTVQDTLLFNLGEIIDNLVSGWIKITGGLNVTNNVEVQDNLSVEGLISGSFLGYIKGAYPIYSSGTEVNITTGNGEVNGHYFRIDSDMNHTISVGGSGDFWYIYINDSLSAYPNVTIYSSTLEPAWSDSLQGWYNGSDRSIGAVWENDSGSVLTYFNAVNEGDVIKITYAKIVDMASAMNPDGTWQTPDDKDGNLVTSVNAVEILVRVSGQDADSTGYAIVTSKELADSGALYYEGQISAAGEAVNFEETGWVVLGSSRQVRMLGEDNDDNILEMRANGFAYSR